jgi:excisionase family DNA binding protein
MNIHDANNDRNSAAAELFTKSEAAAFLKIKIRTLDDWRAAKALPCIERGRWIRFRRADLESFIAAHTIQPRTATPFRPRRTRRATGGSLPPAA